MQLPGRRWTKPTRTRNHPFDVVGWDGCLYPYAFNVSDFEPITGRVHQPPLVHQTFEGPNWVICSFVPRKVDYNPLSIPVPYNHHNVDSDEVLFYTGGNYESAARLGHRARARSRCTPPGLDARSVAGRRGALDRCRSSSTSLAVMVDTFRPLEIGRRRRGLGGSGVRVDVVGPAQRGLTDIDDTEARAVTHESAPLRVASPCVLEKDSGRRRMRGTAGCFEDGRRAGLAPRRPRALIPRLLLAFNATRAWSVAGTMGGGVTIGVVGAPDRVAEAACAISALAPDAQVRTGSAGRRDRGRRRHLGRSGVDRRPGADRGGRRHRGG